MNLLVDFPFEEGGSIFVEVTFQNQCQIIKAGNFSNHPIKAVASFESALDSIKPIASAIISKLNNINNPPDDHKKEDSIRVRIHL